MTTTDRKQKTRFHIPFLEGVLPLKGSQVPAEIIAGLTLAALAIPEVMGYTVRGYPGTECGDFARLRRTL